MTGTIQTPLQTMFGSDGSSFSLDRLVLFALWGVGYNLSRYAHEASKSGVQWSWGKASRTIYIGVIAGVVVGLTDGEMTGEQFELAMVMAVPVANELLGGVDNFRERIFEHRFLTEHTGWDIDELPNGEIPEPPAQAKSQPQTPAPAPEPSPDPDPEPDTEPAPQPDPEPAPAPEPAPEPESSASEPPDDTHSPTPSKRDQGIDPEA